MAHKDQSDRVDVYTRVTNKILEAIEAGSSEGRWEMPWYVPEGMGYPVNAVTGDGYRGVNILTLWVESQLRGYTDPHWATYLQWQSVGKQVRKGEKAAIGVVWKPWEPKDGQEQPAEGDADESRVRMFGRAFPLFNASQIDGYEPPVAPDIPEMPRIEPAETFFASLGADIRHGGAKAFYRPSGDYIQMPPFTAFRDPVAYYATLAHEATHWTGAECRLARDLKGRFGDESYAAEELVAELGAAFLSASLGLTPEPRPDHAIYVQSWLKVLKNDSRAIFTASSLAQKAADSRPCP
ncbi:MAG TPA: zincin-like metallopeptidase domain-containing protein [Fimbriimonadaceae bacterium]|nr:zincin-like metallopeptidase domain-containing protein [Fimbriimonadaceae bacterium]